MVVATLSPTKALLVGDVSDRILSQLRIYGLTPQKQQDASGYRGEFVVVLHRADLKDAFLEVARNLRIQIK